MPGSNYDLRKDNFHNLILGIDKTNTFGIVNSTIIIKSLPQKGVMDGERPLKSPTDSVSTFADFFLSNSSGSAVRLEAFQKRTEGKQKFNPDKARLSFRTDRYGSRAIKNQ